MKKIDIQQLKKISRQLDCNDLMHYLHAHNYKFWSWGATGFLNIEDYAFRFKTNGHHHKGFVYITLAANDTFTVFFTNLQSEILDQMEDVYIDELFERLDKRIEYIKDYDS